MKNVIHLTDGNTGNHEWNDIRSEELVIFNKLKRNGMEHLELCQSPLEQIVLVWLAIHAFAELNQEHPTRVIKRVVPQMGVGFNGELVEPLVKFDDSGNLIEPPYDCPIKYSLDFFVVINDSGDPRCNIKIAVELDGHGYHSSPADKMKDAIKDRFLSRHGFIILRFTGKEIQRDPKIVVDQIVQIGGRWSRSIFHRLK